MILKFKIKNQKLIREDDEYLVNLTTEYLECQFDFMTPDWDNVEKYATFKVKGKSYLYQINDNTVKVPNDILKYKYFYIKLHGTDKNRNRKITTDELIIILKITGWKEQDNYVPSHDLTNKDIVTLLKEKLDTKTDHFELTNNSLICYSDGNIIQIIPFTFLENYYDKTEIDEMFKKTIVNVDAHELGSTGYLIFEKYNL